MTAPPKPVPAASAALTDAVKQAMQTAYDAEDVALVGRDEDNVMAVYEPDVVFFDSLKGTQDEGTAGAR